MEYRPATQDIHLITEIEEDDPPAGDREGTQDERKCHKGSTQSMGCDPPRLTDPSPPNGSAWFPILCQDVRLKDRRWVKLLKSPPAPQPKPRKVSLRKYLECSLAPTAPTTVADDLLGNDRILDLSVSTPSLDWERMVDQLNQDPHTDSVTDSDQETISMGGGRTDITGDEEVEGIYHMGCHWPRGD